MPDTEGLSRLAVESRDDPARGELARLAALYRYEVLDTLPEVAFERIVRLARTICQTEAALIGFADSRRIWFKATLGVTVAEMTCKLAMCHTVVRDAALLVVPDASSDPRFADSVVVKGDGGIRFYAGAPLVTSDGYALQPAITIPANATAVTIGQDGTVSVTQPGVAAAVQIGSIQLATFINPTGLESMGQNLYQQTGSSGTPNTGVPGANGIGTVSQGFVETSNVNVVEELVNMIQAQRAYEMDSKSITASDDMLQKLVAM